MVVWIFYVDKNFKPWISVPFLVCWAIWLARNSTLFSSKYVPPLIIVSLVEARIQEYTYNLVKKNLKNIEPLNFQKDSPPSFFEDASKKNSRICGVGFILYLNERVHISFKENLGSSTKTKVI